MHMSDIDWYCTDCNTWHDLSNVWKYCPNCWGEITEPFHVRIKGKLRKLENEFWKSVFNDFEKIV